jgi:hypothetical protein
MMKLSVLGGFPTTTIALRGQPVTVTAISDADAAMIAGMHAAPVAPLIKDPNRGSAAPSIPNTQDADYRAKVREWNAVTDAAMVAALTDLELENVTLGVAAPTWSQCRTAEAKRAYLLAAVPVVRQGMQSSEIDAVLEAARKLTAAALDHLEQDAKKP